MQRERVAGFGALDVERAGLRVDLGHVEHLGRPVGGRCSRPEKASSVQSCSTVPGRSGASARRRRRSRRTGRARAGTPRRPPPRSSRARQGMPAAPRRWNPAHAHRRSPVHRVEPVRGDPAVCTSAGASRPTGPERPRSVQPCRSPWCRDRRADQRRRSAAHPPAPAAAALVRRRVPALGRRSRGGGGPHAAGSPAGCVRRPHLRRAGPVPDGGAGFAIGPAAPWAGTFLETNVRLYSVDATGRRGVVFLSLDADRAVAVAAPAPRSGCPTAGPRWLRRRRGGRRYTPGAVAGVPGRSRVAIRVGGPAPDGPLERFLTARWGLHVARSGRTRYFPNAHPPWPLRTAEVLELDDGLVAAAGLGTSPGARPTTSCSARAWRRPSGGRAAQRGRVPELSVARPRLAARR